jgi:prepilin-type N-terminal cleavage/methylation domain-containing protein
MARKHGFTLVELLVVIAIIAILLAILLSSLQSIKAMAQRVTCSHKLKGCAEAFTLYVQQQTDGTMPALERATYTYHYYVYRREDPTGSLKYYWYAMGCLYGSGQIENATQFYCPATSDWRDEYKLYCNPMPWGSLPQVANTDGTAGTAGNQWIRVKKGYIYWPMAKDVYKTNAVGEEATCYLKDYPRTPLKFSDMRQSKCLAFDYSWHQVKGSGYNIETVWPDSHVTLNNVPTDEVTGNLLSFDYVADDVKVANNYITVPLVRYAFALQP